MTETIALSHVESLKSYLITTLATVDDLIIVQLAENGNAITIMNKNPDTPTGGAAVALSWQVVEHY